MKHQKERSSKERGQVLLIIIMVLATIVTVSTTISYRSVTESQISKLEEESHKTLAAAEAGIEKALVEELAAGALPYSFSGLQLTSLDSSQIDLGESKVNVSTQLDTVFVAPLLQKDQQYTFYMAEYDGTTFSNPYTGEVRVRYGSEGACSAVGLEISVLSGSTPMSVRRYVASTASPSLFSSATDNIGRTNSATVQGVTFQCETDPITPPADVRLILVKVVGASSRLAFVGTSSPLRPQGKFIISEAQSVSGITKKVQLFQSFPQIPAEFFVTSF